MSFRGRRKGGWSLGLVFSFLFQESSCGPSVRSRFARVCIDQWWLRKNDSTYVFILTSDDGHVCKSILRLYEQVSKRADLMVADSLRPRPMTARANIVLTSMYVVESLSNAANVVIVATNNLLLLRSVNAIFRCRCRYCELHVLEKNIFWTLGLARISFDFTFPSSASVSKYYVYRASGLYVSIST
jgi:archaellum biogenesis ATPase FlaH